VRQKTTTTVQAHYDRGAEGRAQYPTPARMPGRAVLPAENAKTFLVPETIPDFPPHRLLSLLSFYFFGKETLMDSLEMQTSRDNV
jgi:hypothetical protein